MHLIAHFESKPVDEVFHQMHNNTVAFNEGIRRAVIPKLEHGQLIKYWVKDDQEHHVWRQMTEELLLEITQRGYLVMGVIGTGGSSTIFLVRNVNRTLISSKDMYCALVINTMKTQDILPVIYERQQNRLLDGVADVYEVFEFFGDLAYYETEDVHARQLNDKLGSYSVSITELLTPLDFYLAGKHMGSDGVEKLRRDLLILLTKLKDQGFYCSDLKLANTSVDITGNLKLIDLESVRAITERYPSDNDIKSEVGWVVSDFFEDGVLVYTPDIRLVSH